LFKAINGESESSADPSVISRFEDRIDTANSQGQGGAGYYVQFT